MDSAQRSLAQLVSEATQDARTLVRSEVTLAKAELRADAIAAVSGAAAFIVALAAAGGAGLMLLFAAAHGLMAHSIAPWLAFVIVSVALLVVSAVAALIGRSRVGRAGPPVAAIRAARTSMKSLQSTRHKA